MYEKDSYGQAHKLKVIKSYIYYFHFNLAEAKKLSCKFLGKRMSVLKTNFAPLFLCFIFLLCACFPKQNKEVLLINGAGASFPYILYSKWLSEYRRVDPLVAVNYQSIGSGGGIRQFLTGTLDFGGTDVPVSEKEIKSSKRQVLHIPTALGAVAITYNLKSLGSGDLRLDGKLLSEIFRGKIKKWSDSQIKRLNPLLKLPEKDIVVVYRADASGTTSFFTNYLSLISEDFLRELGKGKSVSWPVGVGGKGNEGVMGLVNKIDGAIAYIGLSYAQSQKLPTAAVKNKEGRFVKPSLRSVQASAQQAIKNKKDYTSSLIYIKGKDAYPMSGFTYIIIAKKMPKQKGKAIVKFLKWILVSGQKFSESLYFTPLPDAVVQSALKHLSQAEFE